MSKGTAESLVKVLDYKNLLAKNLKVMGVDASEREGLESLVPKVLSISSDVKDSETGTFTPSAYTRKFTLESLGFLPKSIAIVSTEMFAPSLSLEDTLKRPLSMFYYNLELVDEADLTKPAGCYATRSFDTSIENPVFIAATLSGSVGNNASLGVFSTDNDSLIVDITKLKCYLAAGVPYQYVVHG